ncbi:hypothetical protein P7K49_000944 [Saguinus oedipus]|uniref:Uncharacterized protein n=1 Tax=Saguinus oedipus TaxID=9490 RepID=A0ABQ9WFN0_SAGOE|nr:hypothetical protein P7K49_000944 [Saguinus oedipus]
MEFSEQLSSCLVVTCATFNPAAKGTKEGHLNQVNQQIIHSKGLRESSGFGPGLFRRSTTRQSGPLIALLPTFPRLQKKLVLTLCSGHFSTILPALKVKGLCTPGPLCPT